MVLQINNLQKQYAGFCLNCSLELKEGYVTGLIGQNGAGKSTTFKAILDLVRPEHGSIKIWGKTHQELTSLDRQNIGVVLSDSGFSNYFTLKDIVRILESFYVKFDKSAFLEKCTQYGLPESKLLKDYSTGMKAKLKLLTALSYSPRLLILDEPTAGLDVVARDELLDLLRSYMKEEERAILVSSHISTDLEGLCDDIYMIHQGNIVLHEDTDILLSDYGLLKLDETTFSQIDKQYILKIKKEPFGYSCLTNQKQYYQENYPGCVIERGTIDEIITMTVKGESL